MVTRKTPTSLVFRGKIVGAGDGNRTRMASLEGREAQLFGMAIVTDQGDSSDKIAWWVIGLGTS